MTQAVSPETSMYLAQLLGPVVLVLGAALLINPRTYMTISKELNTNCGLLVIAGLAALTSGLAIILHHNLWVADWPVLITIIGWLMMLSGLSRLLAPAHVIAWGNRMLSGPDAFRAAGLLYAALGFILTAIGYAT